MRHQVDVGQRWRVAEAEVTEPGVCRRQRFNRVEASGDPGAAPSVDFCFGQAPTLADVYLVPQVESSRRFKVDMNRWPRISAIDAACASIPAFAQAAPMQQPDAA